MPRDSKGTNHSLNLVSGYKIVHLCYILFINKPIKHLKIIKKIFSSKSIRVLFTFFIHFLFLIKFAFFKYSILILTLFIHTLFLFIFPHPYLLILILILLLLILFLHRIMFFTFHTFPYIHQL